MKQEELSKILGNVRNFMSNQNVGYICYIWDKEGSYGGGCSSAGADPGDAMVAIEKILRVFNINPEALAFALKQTRS